MKKELKYDEIKRRAKGVGLTLSALCRITGVERQSLHHWKASDTKSIVTYFTLMDEIETREIPKEKTYIWADVEELLKNNKLIQE